MKVSLRENVDLVKPGSNGVLLGEAVRERGLNPAVFCAVIPGECGTAGVINANGRIYDVQEAVLEHERLCANAKADPSFGERDHPEGGESWNVITRLIGGKTAIDESGAAKFYGDFAVINSSLGRDMLVNWQAGVPVGVSLRALGVLTEHVINETSPYAKMNPGSVGRRVNLVSEVEFRGYDWVRVPSAGTYLPPQVTEAFKRLTEAVEADPEEKAMFKTFADFEKAHPEAAKELRAELAAEHAAKLTESVSQKDAEVARLSGELREAKAASAGQAEMLKELVEAKRKQDAELATAKLKGDVIEALDKFIVGRRAGATIKANVLEELSEGRITDVAQATARAEKYAAVAEAGAQMVPAPEGEKLHEASDGGVNKPTPVAGAANKLKALRNG